MKYSTIVPNYRTNEISCSICKSLELIAIPSNSTHFASLRCGECDRFLGWLEKPENTQQREQENSLISDLLLSPKLNGWERMFLRSVRETKKRSSRQREKLRQIAERVGFSASLLKTEGGES